MLHFERSEEIMRPAKKKGLMLEIRYDPEHLYLRN